MLRVIMLALVLAQGVSVQAGESTSSARDRVSFSVSADERVASDVLVVTMSAQHEAPRQAESAEPVNQAIAWALAQARAAAGVRVQTLDYRTHPVYDDRRVRAWRSQQGIRLESSDQQKLAALLAELQTRLAIDAMGYEISPAVREGVETRLIDTAIARFSARAAQVAASFQRRSYGIVEVRIGRSGQRPPAPVLRGMAMPAQLAEPGVEAGEQTLSVTVDGTIELSAD